VAQSGPKDLGVPRRRVRTRASTGAKMQFKDVSAVLGTWVSIAAAVIGGYLAIDSYKADVAARVAAEHKRVDEKVQAAFQMIEEFHRPDFISMRSRLVESAGQGAPCRDFTPPSAISPQEVYTLVEYFDRAHICIDAGLCDKAVTEQLLSPYADWWWPWLERQVNDTRTQEGTAVGAGYGMGLKAFATSPHRAPQCPSR
jgi:hypothetical protein